MAEGTIAIHCPHCGYPYPMTRLQIDVYIGRSMGCMHCGKSFPVTAPAPPQQENLPEPDETAAQTPPPLQKFPPQGLPPQGPLVAPPAPAEQSGLGWLAMAAGVLFIVLAAVAAICGYSGSSGNAIKAASRSRMPITLLQIAYGIAVVGAIAGVAAVLHRRRSQAGDTRHQAGGIAGAAAVVCLGEVVLASLLALMVMPRLNSGLAESHQAACQANLQTIGYALIAGASERTDGRFVDSLGDLVKTGKVGIDAVLCPADEHATLPKGGTPAEWAALMESGQHVSYVYLGKGMAMRPAGGRRVSTHTVLAYEPPGLHGDAESFHLLFADGTVVFARKEQANQILSELKSGQNPPPTSAAVRP